MAFETPITPPTGLRTLASFTEWWNSAEGSAKARNAWNQYFGPQQDAAKAKRASYSSWQDSWTSMKWAGSPWEARSNQQQAGMDELANQLRGWNPKSSSNMSDANAYAAGIAGMTPEEYNTLLDNWNKRFTDPNYAAEQDALSATKYGETIANSEFAKEQEQANRVALRQMEDKMGKQLEAIFGERGGLGGFQAAYELTSQLQNSWLQNQTQQHLAIFNQAVAAVNANNGYYSDMITRGEMSAKDYLTFRYSQLQDGFQNYVTMMAQTRADFELQYQISEDERIRIDANFASQIEQMENQMYLEMGGNTDVEAYIKELYDEFSQGVKDLEAIAATKEESHDKNVRRGFGFLGLFVGLAILFIPLPGARVAGGALITAGMTGLLS